MRRSPIRGQSFVPGDSGWKVQQGFTLVEVVVSLVLLGVLGIFASYGLVSGTRAYVFSREIATVTQRAEMALGRMQYEFAAINEVTWAKRDQVDFTTTRLGPSVSYRIYLDGGDDRVYLRIDDGGSTETFALLTDLAAYGAGDDLFTYVHADGGTWKTSVDDMDTLARIDIALLLPNPVDPGTSDQLTFSLSVNPRNNGVPNGPPPRKPPV